MYEYTLVCIYLFQKGMPIYIVWAYHPMSDELKHHGNDYRGVYSVTLIPAIAPTPTMMMVPSTAVVQPVLHSDLIMLDGKGNYNVSYYYNANSDKLEFMVQVRTTGWVGFGVAEVAPNNMSYYDVAIGGVRDNGTNYLQVRKNWQICIQQNCRYSSWQNLT